MQPASSVCTRGAISSCTSSTRSAEQRWPALLKPDCTTSSTSCSASAELSASITLRPPVSAISVPMAPGRAAIERSMMRAVSVEPVNTTPASRGSRVSAAPTSAPSPGTNCSASGGTPACSSRPGRVGRRQRRLFRGLRDHGVAGRERRGHLSGEDRQRKIPRTDAAEHALAAQAQQVALAGGARQRRLVRKVAARAHRVVAQEVHRLAHFADGIGQRLAGLAHAARDERGGVLLEQLRGALEHRGALFAAGRVPVLLRARSAAPIAASTVAASAFVTLPICSAVLAGIDAPRCGCPLRVWPDDRPAPRSTAAARPRSQSRSKRIHRLAVGEIEAGGIEPLGREQVHRQRNARMRHALQRIDLGDGIRHHLLGRQARIDDAIDERGVGAVLEQAPHQVGQQVFVRTHRRVDAAGVSAPGPAHHAVVQLRAHAVQALEFEAVRRRRRTPRPRARWCARCAWRTADRCARRRSRAVCAQARYDTSVFGLRVNTG